MVAVDSSTWIAYIQGQTGTDIEQLDASLASGDMAFPPVVLTEILSDAALPNHHRSVVLGLPTLEITEGYWARAAATRSRVLVQKLRARLPDALIVQSCIDHDMPLITRDHDFGHFVKHCGLKLA